MHPRAVLAFCVFMLAAMFSRGEIGIGDAREDVLRQLGTPTSRARRGNHEILLYPKGGRVELIDGKVVDVKGVLPVAPVVSGPAAPPPAKAPGVTEDLPGIVPEPGASGTAGGINFGDEYNPAAMSHELAQHVEKMDTAWGMAPPKQELHSPLEMPVAFATGLLFRFLFTVFALKVAFKYWEMDAFWSGIFLIAGIDLVLHAIFALLGPLSGGFTTLIAVENGLPGLVMIYTIHRFCFNKRLQNAVLTAAGVKLVVTLCYLFVALGAMNMIFG